MKKALVSVITPSYNSEKFIRQTLNSVIAQTYQNWELIVVDDCSLDKSVEIIKDYVKKDKRIQLHQLLKNSGAGVARNVAIRKATGHFIAFLDSDDVWLPQKLELQLKFMIKNDYHLTYTSYKLIDEQGLEISKTIKCKKKLSYKNMLTSNKIGCLTAMYNKDYLGKIYMPEVRKRQDYALWLKILKMEDYAFGLPTVLAYYRDRSNSVSNNKIEMIKWNWNLFKNIEKLSYFRATLCVASNVYVKLIQWIKKTI